LEGKKKIGVTCFVKGRKRGQVELPYGVWVFMSLCIKQYHTKVHFWTLSVQWKKWSTQM